MNRHQAEMFCRTVYVQRAWKNLAAASDTVLQKSTVRTPPAITTFGTNLVVAYAIPGNTIVTKYYNGQSWANISNISLEDSVVAMRMTSINDQSNSAVFLAILTTANKLYVYKTASVNSAWTAVGQPISGATSLNFTACASSSSSTAIS